MTEYLISSMIAVLVFSTSAFATDSKSSKQCETEAIGSNNAAVVQTTLNTLQEKFPKEININFAELSADAKIAVTAALIKKGYHLTNDVNANKLYVDSYGSKPDLSKSSVTEAAQTLSCMFSGELGYILYIHAYVVKNIVKTDNGYLNDDKSGVISMGSDSKAICKNDDQKTSDSKSIAVILSAVKSIE